MVVVVTYHGSVFGLLANAVRGVVLIEDEAHLDVSVNTELPLFTRTFERPDDNAAVSVLDCAAVKNTPGMVLAADTGGPSGAVAQAQQAASGISAGGRSMMMLLRCGEIGLAVDVSHIHSVVPELILKSSPLDGPTIHGVLELGERFVPTVDTSRCSVSARSPRLIEDSVRKFLTYDAGVDVATPLTQITEIVPFPAEVIPFVGGGPLRGVFTHQRATVPLICLTTLLGRPADIDESTARVLLIEARGTRFGFIVPHLRAIEESVWEERRPDADPDGPVSLAGSPLVKIGGRMLPRIDLEQMVRTMVTDHAADPAGDRRSLAHA